MNIGRMLYHLRYFAVTGILTSLSVTVAYAASPATVASGVAKNVLAENFTGTWCPYCPGGAAELKELQKKHGNLIVISYHYNDVMDTPEGTTFNDNVNNSLYPSAMINRILFPGQPKLPLPREVWGSKIAEAAAIPSPFDITVAYTYDETTRKLDLSVETLALQDLTRKYRLNVMVTEDSLNYRQKIINTPSGEVYPYYHMNVLRRAFTGQFGEAFIDSPVKKGTVLQKTYSFILANNVAPGNANIIVFIHENLSNNIGPVQQAVRFPVIAPPSPIFVRENAAPVGFALTGNHPNPFNPSTTISFTLPASGPASLAIYDITGRKVRELVNGRMSAGAHSVVWDGRNTNGKAVSSGVYFSRLTQGKKAVSGRMLLVK
ncbi:MAG: Omp28-related outer membrane protein [Candidatus Latescibacterota bacterium]